MWTNVEFVSKVKERPTRCNK